MTRTRKWSMLTALVAALVLIAGWFLLVSPNRASADDLRAQAATQQNTNAGLTAKLQQLKQQQKGVPAEQAKIADIQQRIPANPALPSLVRSLSSMAISAGVSIATLTPTTPVPSAVTTAVGAIAPDGSSLQVIGLTVQVTGSYYNIERFLGKVETLKRALLVTGVTLNVDAVAPASGAATTTAVAGSSPNLVAVLSIRAFMVSSALAPGGSPLHAAPPTTTGAAGAPASASTTPAH
jgi:type IV pilus assembly protein PilO